MKRFYKVGETVWVKESKEKAVVKSLDTKNLEAVIEYVNSDKRAVVKFMGIDKLQTSNRPKEKKVKSKTDTVLVAKVHKNSDAKIPSKRDEDAGYDFYACFKQMEMRLPKHKPTLVPTGIATSLLPKYYLNLKHERGSTGMHGMAVLSGVVDSGFRGEIFINITPLYKDVVISKNVDKVIETDNEIIYPYSKGIAQGTFELIPDLAVKEISYEDLKAIPSVRGTGALGDSGK